VAPVTDNQNKMTFPKTVSNSEPKLRRVYPFSKGVSDGGKEMKALLGGKGANLCEMAKIGLNVPPGFTITTEVCEQFHQAGGKLPEGLWEEVLDALHFVESTHGGKFGDVQQPLLVSIRSGAALSMPGMMDTGTFNAMICELVRLYSLCLFPK
jgi:pyruvate, orthophosphate dikinase